MAVAHAADEAGTGEAEVEIPEHAPAGQAARPLLEDVEMAGGVAAARHGADGRAGDDVELEAAPHQHAQDADVGKAACGAAAQHQTGGGPGRLHDRRFADGRVLDRNIGGGLDEGRILARGPAAIGAGINAIGAPTARKEVKHGTSFFSPA